MTSNTRFEKRGKKLIIFVFSGHFRGLLYTILGSSDVFRAVTPNTRFDKRCKKTSFLRFFAVFVVYCTLFWGPGSIFVAVTPYTRFEKRRKNSPFLPFLVVFEFYCGKKLTVFAFSSCFRGLLHTILGCWDVFRGRDTQYKF